MDSENYGQFSVILRPRCGIPCLLSTYEIMMEIRNKLSKYKGIVNVGVSPPNFVVHLTTVEQQLDMLSCSELITSSVVLDILPWSAEYISVQIPWIKNNSPAACIQIDQVCKDAHTTAENISKDKPTKETQLTLPMQGILGTANNVHGNIAEEQTVTTPSVDFSYLMILELKDFYHSKTQAFLRCEDSYKHLCSLAQPFSDDVEPRIESIYQQAERYSSMPPTEILAAVPHFGASLNYQQLFISEEIFGLHMTMHSIRQCNTNPISLEMYQIEQPNGQLITPNQSTQVLRAVFQAVVQAVYPNAETVTVHEEYDDYIYTKISSATFQHKYRLSKPATQDEAEALSYYRFLKHTTNVLGYSIVDDNWTTLKEIVCQINQYTHLISDLQYCVDKVGSMVSTVEKNIKDMYQELLDEVPAEKIPYLCATVNSLLSLIQDYSASVNHAIQAFNSHKKEFRSIKFGTMYPAKADEA